MHCNKSVAFEFYLGSKKRKNGNYRLPFLTIWHVDPETDCTDDSCGYFIRLRHADQNIYKSICKEFEFNWDRTYTSDNGYVYNNGWFDKNGNPTLSVSGIVLNMFRSAAWKVFESTTNNDSDKTRKKVDKLLSKHLPSILLFAENNVDSMFDIITRKFQIGTNTPYTEERRKYMIENCAEIIYTYILRLNRKWYQHPKWHIHHWEIQFNWFTQLKRRYWDKCCKCGKRGFKSSPFSNWRGTEIWHQHCDDNHKTNK